MPYKIFTFEDIGEVKIYKHRSSRSIKLSLRSTGELRVTIPYWTNYSVALKFLAKNKEWILKQNRPKLNNLTDQLMIGKNHRLVFVKSDTGNLRSRVDDNYITIYVPDEISINEVKVQKIALSASKKALKKELELLLPNRINNLASSYGFEYQSITSKSLKGHWGSCDQNRNLTFNIFLMQLPWNLIDYVIVHELTHTKHMNHSAEFWNEFETHIPTAKKLRNEIKSYRPIISIE